MVRQPCLSLSRKAVVKQTPVPFKEAEEEEEALKERPVFTSGIIKFEMRCTDALFFTYLI